MSKLMGFLSQRIVKLMSTRREIVDQARKAYDEAEAPAWKAYEEAMAQAEKLPE